MLGVTFGKSLNLINHCRSKATKAMQRVQLLRMVSGKNWGANDCTLLRLYKQYIRHVLETGSVITREACPLALSKLEVVQNSALRTCLRAPPWTRLCELHTRSKIDPLTDRLRSLRCKAEARFGDSDCIKALNFQRIFMSGSTQ